jgi:hypothetical protein
VGWQLTKKLTPSVEYYASLGPVKHLLPVHDQVQLIVPGADWTVAERLKWSFGVGIGMTGGTDHLILKSRFEFEFGRAKK